MLREAVGVLREAVGGLVGDAERLVATHQPTNPPIHQSQFLTKEKRMNVDNEAIRSTKASNEE